MHCHMTSFSQTQYLQVFNHVISMEMNVVTYNTLTCKILGSFILSKIC